MSEYDRMLQRIRNLNSTGCGDGWPYVGLSVFSLTGVEVHLARMNERGQLRTVSGPGITPGMANIVLLGLKIFDDGLKIFDDLQDRSSHKSMVIIILPRNNGEDMWAFDADALIDSKWSYINNIIHNMPSEVDLTVDEIATMLEVIY